MNNELYDADIRKKEKFETKTAHSKREKCNNS